MGGLSEAPQKVALGPVFCAKGWGPSGAPNPPKTGPKQACDQRSQGCAILHPAQRVGRDVSSLCQGEIGGPRRTTGANAVPSPLPRGGQLAGWRQGPLGFLAQLVRASSLHLECQRFKSVRTQACSNSRRGGAPRTPPQSGRGCRANPLRGVAFCLIAFACDAEKTILIGGLGPQSFGRNNLATFGRKLALGPGRAPWGPSGAPKRLLGGFA